MMMVINAFSSYLSFTFLCFPELSFRKKITVREAVAQQVFQKNTTALALMGVLSIQGERGGVQDLRPRSFKPT